MGDGRRDIGNEEGKERKDYTGIKLHSKTSLSSPHQAALPFSQRVQRKEEMLTDSWESIAPGKQTGSEGWADTRLFSIR